MPKKKREWRPKPLTALMKRNVRTMRDGEPNTLELHRYNTDRTLRTSVDNSCCDCGLRHLLVFEVFRDPTGKFFLNKRAYRLAK